MTEKNRFKVDIRWAQGGSKWNRTVDSGSASNMEKLFHQTVTACDTVASVSPSPVSIEVRLLDTSYGHAAKARYTKSGHITNDAWIDHWQENRCDQKDTTGVRCYLVTGHATECLYDPGSLPAGVVGKFIIADAEEKNA
jgi:hypothetical protein